MLFESCISSVRLVGMCEYGLPMPSESVLLQYMNRTLVLYQHTWAWYWHHVSNLSITRIFRSRLRLILAIVRTKEYHIMDIMDIATLPTQTPPSVHHSRKGMLWAHCWLWSIKLSLTAWTERELALPLAWISWLRFCTILVFHCTLWDMQWWV